MVQGLWSSLHPRLVSLTVADCINVADECICAITQLLPALYEFNLQVRCLRYCSEYCKLFREISETNTYNNSQAYHVTDSALSYFSPKQTGTLNVLRLQSCWEITNHGLVNIGQFNTADAVNNAMKVIHLHLSNFFSVHSLPNLTILSLSGCSKVTDDGIELIAENLRKLVSLDLSWCPRITDAALEYIACDLTHLEELTLDRSSNTSVTISRHKFSMGQDIQNI